MTMTRGGPNSDDGAEERNEEEEADVLTLADEDEEAETRGVAVDNQAGHMFRPSTGGSPRACDTLTRMCCNHMFCSAYDREQSRAYGHVEVMSIWAYGHVDVMGIWAYGHVEVMSIWAYGHVDVMGI